MARSVAIPAASRGSALHSTTMLLIVTLVLADDSVFLGEGPERTSYAALLESGSVKGRTGGLVGQLRPGELLPPIHGVRTVDELPDGVVRIHLAPGTDDLALARELHAHPAFAWVHPDLLLNLVPARVPNDPLYADQWHHDNTGQGGRTGNVDINTPIAWDIATGAGITVGVLDSGVQLDHPDLVVRGGHDYVDRDDDASPGADSSGPHGTGVAGIASARGDNGLGVAGVAWESEVYAIRLIGGSTSTSDLYDAFSEAVDAGAGVLNNSWGFGGCGQVSDSTVFGQMFRYAERKGRDGLGTVVVFAAGNDGCDNSDDPMLSHEEALVVAALEWSDQRASYSNWGDDVRIAAPTGILTTDTFPGGYGSYGDDDGFADGFSGTSGASPVVAGVVALMLEANPRATAEQVRDIVCQTARRNDLAGADWDSNGWSPYYGCGAIDAGAAVATIANTAPSAPVPRLVRDTTWVDHTVLAWEAAHDPDGDVSAYVVEYWLDGDEETLVSDVVTDRILDLSGEFEPNTALSWRVAAIDPWGTGPWSVETSFTVAATPEPPAPADTPEEPPAGCSAGAPASVAGIFLVAALAGRRRR